MDRYIDEGKDNLLYRIKMSIFDVLCIIQVESEKGSIMVLFARIFADFVQLLIFPFNSIIQPLWKSSSFLDFIFTMASYLSTSKYFPSVQYSGYLASMYLLIGLIVLLLADLVYVQVSFQRKRFIVMWPLHVLRSVISVIVTVLFMPITETLINIISCEEGEFGYVMRAFPTVICWQGWHIMHAVLSCTFNLIFTIICTIAAYTLFEPRMNSGDPTARSDSKGEVTYILNKVICQVIFSFLSWSDSWILVIITVLMALQLYYEYNLADPYYDFRVGLYYNILSSFYLWTCIWLLISQVLYETTFDGQMVCWGLGLPFIAAIMLSSKKSRIETLVSSQKKFRSAEQVAQHIRYVLQLIANVSDKNSHMLLIGYIENHKEACQFDECQLKSRYNKRLTEDINHQIEALIIELDKLFVQTLQKFPQSALLRIQYAFFVLEKRANKKKAYQELCLAAKVDTTFYQEFIIHRFCKLIRENSEGNKENSDVISMIEYENHMLQCDEAMRISAQLHKDFWIELKEEQPDLKKLNIIGHRIGRATGLVRESYKKMQKLNGNVFQSIRAYALFLILVLNSKEGKLLLKQAEIIRKLFSTLDESFNIDSEMHPIMMINMKTKNQNVININSLVISHLGYQKQELIGKPLSVLLPQPYSRFHSYYLQKFYDQFKEGEPSSDYINEDQVGFLKHKNGYLIPVNYKVLIKPEILQYLVILDTEAVSAQYTYLIVNKDSIIAELSTGAISLFDIDVKTLHKNSTLALNSYIPEILRKGQQDVYFGRILNNVESIFYLRCFVKQIRIREVNDQLEVLGIFNEFYVVKIERIQESEAKMRSRASRQSVDLSKLNPIASRNVLLSMNDHTFQQDHQQVSFDLMNAFNEQPDERIQQQVMQIFSREEEQKELIRQDTSRTAKGIKTKRLINSMIVEINEEEEEQNLQSLELQDPEDSIFINKNEFQINKREYIEFTLKKEQAIIIKSLTLHFQHPSIKRLFTATRLYCIIYLTLSIYQWVFCRNVLEDQKNYLEVNYFHGQIIFYLSTIIGKNFDMFRVAYNPNFEHDDILDDSRNAAVTINNISSIMFASSSYQYLQTQNYTLRLDASFEYSILESIKMVTAYSQNIINTTTLSDLYPLFEIYYGGLKAKILASKQLVYEAAIEEITGFSYQEIIQVILIALVTTILTIMSIYLMVRIHMEREKVLFLFLSIPEIHIGYFQRQCEHFLKAQISIVNFIENDDTDEINDDIAERQNINIDIIDSETIKKQNQKNKRILEKYYNNSTGAYIRVVLSVIFVCLIPLTNYMYQFISFEQSKTFMQLVWPQFHVYQQFLPDYLDHLAYFGISLLDNTYEINNISIMDIQTQHFSHFKNNQDKLRKFSSAVYNEFTSFSDNYTTIQYYYICQPVIQDLTAEQNNSCWYWLNETLQSGLAVIEQTLLMYFEVQLENYQQNLTDYIAFMSDQDYFQICYSMDHFIGPGVNTVLQLESTILASLLDQSISITLIILIVYNIGLLIGYALLIPYLNQHNKEINSTIEMLNMVPIEIIKQTKPLRDFVRQRIAQMDQELYQ